MTADVSIYQLIFTDADLLSFDTNLKVQPPFRGATDRAALLEGLRDGTLDALVSNHQPQDYDSKFCEFDHAAFGTIGLETLFLSCYQEAIHRKISFIDKLLSSNPANLVGLNMPALGKGSKAKGILFQNKKITSKEANDYGAVLRSIYGLIKDESTHTVYVFLFLNSLLILSSSALRKKLISSALYRANTPFESNAIMRC